MPLLVRFALAAALVATSGCRSIGARCDDGLLNGGETDIDCGGGECVACPVGRNCLWDDDCATDRCANLICAAIPHCNDGLLDGDETDVDCGASCGYCNAAKKCKVPTDCRSRLCIHDVCAAMGTCSDNLKDQDESDIDCGGACPACPTGAACNTDNDCQTGLCTAGTCQAFPCADGTKDNDETDVDCGGSCSPCGTGMGCKSDIDCASDMCEAGKCLAQTAVCSLGYKQDPKTQLCICDPSTCNTCCNVSEDNGCGNTGLPRHNNCGGHGQSCFNCPVTEECARDNAKGDYCAPQCSMVTCTGCCATGRALLLYCYHGDDDGDCGTNGDKCVRCPDGTHCVNHQCK